MAIRTWHWGKLVILWGWGLVVAGPLFAFFLRQRGQDVSSGQATAFLASVLILLALSAVTWRWLGGREP